MTPRELRLFFAVDLPEAAAAPLARVRDVLSARSARGVRWLDARGLHVTLHFLGGVPEPGVAPLSELLLALTRDRRAIPVTLRPLSAFPAPRRARVVVAPLDDPTRELTRLAEALKDGAAALGFPRDDRAFRPHVTLARLKVPSNVRELLGHAPPLDQPLLVDRVVLYCSELGESGSRYHPLACVHLPAPSVDPL